MRWTLLLAALLLPAAAWAITPIRVSVRVQADDINEPILLSCFNREFRNLGAVISDDRPDFIVATNVMEIEGGLAAAVAILDTWDVTYVRDWLVADPEDKSGEMLQQLKAFLDDAGKLVATLVATSPAAAGLCTSIVAQVDTGVLEGTRQLRQRLDEAIRRQTD